MLHRNREFTKITSLDPRTLVSCKEIWCKGLTRQYEIVPGRGIRFCSCPKFWIKGCKIKTKGSKSQNSKTDGRYKNIPDPHVSSNLFCQSPIMMVALSDLIPLPLSDRERTKKNWSKDKVTGSISLSSFRRRSE